MRIFKKLCKNCNGDGFFYLPKKHLCSTCDGEGIE